MIQKTVLVTGACGRIGRVLVSDLFRKGHRLVVISRSADRLAVLRDETSGIDPNALETLVADLMQPNAATRLEEELAARGVRVDAFIHAARDLETLRNCDENRSDRQKWANEFALQAIVPCDLTVTFAASRFHHLRRVILLGSIYGSCAPNLGLYTDPKSVPPIHYGVCKAAAVHLAKELAVRYAARAITVNVVSFGGVEGRVGADFTARYAGLCPQGRMLADNDLPGMVSFLLTEEAAAITGQNILVDGGWSVW